MTNERWEIQYHGLCASPTQSHRTRLNGAPTICLGHPPPRTICGLDVPLGLYMLGAGVPSRSVTVAAHLPSSVRSSLPLSC